MFLEHQAELEEPLICDSVVLSRSHRSCLLDSLGQGLPNSSLHSRHLVLSLHRVSALHLLKRREGTQPEGCCLT